MWILQRLFNGSLWSLAWAQGLALKGCYVIYSALMEGRPLLTCSERPHCTADGVLLMMRKHLNADHPNLHTGPRFCPPNGDWTIIFMIMRKEDSHSGSEDCPSVVGPDEWVARAGLQTPKSKAFICTKKSNKMGLTNEQSRVSTITALTRST